jgi:acyl-CoA synthetase (NDP forming)
MAHWLRRLLSPRTIAIVGASEREGSLAAITHRQLGECGFAGQVYSVNPKYQVLFGDTCYPSLGQLPAVPDLVVYAISGLALERSFDEAVALGVGGILIYAANYIDGDREPRLTERLRQKAAAAGIPVCGGNSMGFYNYDERVMVSFDRPPAGRPAGHIGMILHSGSGMTYLANNDLRFCYNYVIASGQETNASVGDYMDYLLRQPSTRVIAVMLETVRDVPAFVAALELAREKSIPVVITSLGRTEQSAQMARSHSGAIVGDHDGFAALCRRHGAILAHDADEMIVTAMLFAAGFAVDGGALASMLDSGGMREQMIDLAAAHGVEFAAISPATVEVLRKHLEVGLEAVNPMDGMGALGRNSQQTFLECGKALLDDPGTGLLSFEFEFRDGFSHYPELFEVTRQLAAYNDKPVMLVNSCSFASLDRTAAEFTWAGIPVVNGIDVCLRAIRNLLGYRRGSASPAAPSAPEFDAERIERWRQRLADGSDFDEIESLALMADFGLPAVEFVFAESRQALLQVVEDLGWPLVLKTAAPGIAHKSDHDGVRTGIGDRAQLETAYADISARLGPRVVAMPMVEAGVEVALGMKYDEQFGPLVIVACGGVLVELLAERAFSLAPVDAAGAEAMLEETRLGKLLAGVRGREPANRAALVDLVVRFSALLAAFGDGIAEVDLNPVIVNRGGCRIVDALVVPRSWEPLSPVSP